MIAVYCHTKTLNSPPYALPPYACPPSPGGVALLGGGAPVPCRGRDGHGPYPALRHHHQGPQQLQENTTVNWVILMKNILKCIPTS